jgi:hypothetical protein
MERRADSELRTPNAERTTHNSVAQPRKNEPENQDAGGAAHDDGNKLALILRDPQDPEDQGQRYATDDGQPSKG